MADMGTTNPTQSPNFNPLDPKTWLPMPAKNLLGNVGTPEGEKAALAYGMVPVPDVHVYQGMQGLASLGQGIAQWKAKSDNREILNQILAGQNQRQKQGAADMSAYVNGGVTAPATTVAPQRGGMALTKPVPVASEPSPAPAAQPPAQYAYSPPSTPDARPAIMGGGMALTQPPASQPKGMTGPLPSSAASGGSPPETTSAQPQANASPVPTTTRPQTAPPDNRMIEVDGKIAAIDQQIKAASALFANPANHAFANAELTRLQQMRNQYDQLRIKNLDPAIQMQQRMTEMQLKGEEQKLAVADRQQKIMEGFLAGEGGNGQPATGPTNGTVAPALNGQGQMPPGTYPGGMNAQAGIEASMVPLSVEAQRYKRMMEIGGLTGNKALETAGKQGLDADPTFEARKKQSTDMGGDAARRSEMKRTGTNILRSYAQLQHSFNETPDDLLNGAIGPYNAQPSPENHGWLPNIASTPGMTPPQAAAAAKQGSMLGPLNPARWYGNADAWDTQNLFQHDVHGLTNSFMTGAGKGMNMSDKRQETFDSTMKDFMKATSREKANEVLGHAKTIIMNDFGLMPDEAEKAIQSHMHEIQVGQIQSMPLDKLQKMDPKKMTTEQLKIAHDRIEAGR